MDANTTETYGFSDEILVTASRLPQAEADVTSSVTVIDAVGIERLGEPLVAPLLRLTP